jgi:hypothetical protein
MRPNVLLSCCVLLTFCVVSGCSRAPQVSASNRKLLEALQTAVSAKEPQWLEKVVKHVSDRRAKNEMTDAEYNAISRIAKKAEAGDWKSALKDVFALSEAQRPLPEDLAMLKNQKNAKVVATN